jgi:hypothetical protein
MRLEAGRGADGVFVLAAAADETVGEGVRWDQ